MRVNFNQAAVYIHFKINKHEYFIGRACSLGKYHHHQLKTTTENIN